MSTSASMQRPHKIPLSSQVSEAIDFVETRQIMSYGTYCRSRGIRHSAMMTEVRKRIANPTVRAVR